MDSLLASSNDLLESLHALLAARGWWLRTVSHTKNLGVDFECQLPSAHISRDVTPVSTSRLEAQTKRKGRYLHLRQLGANSGKVASQSARPAITYGVAVIGCTAKQLDKARTLMGGFTFGQQGAAASL